MKKIFFVLGIFIVVVALIMCGTALKNYSGENMGNEIKVIETKEKSDSNKNKEIVLKNLNANMSISVRDLTMQNRNKLAEINKTNLKPIDVKIEKIVVKNKDMKLEKIMKLNVSVNEINKDDKVLRNLRSMQ